MNSILLFEQDLIKPRVYRLQDERAAHILQHIKIQKGAELNITLEGQGLAKARGQRIAENQVELEVCSEIQVVSPSLLSVAIALSRPPTLKKILEHGTTLGVGNFYFFNAELSEKSFSQSKVLRPEFYQKLLDLGLSQSRAYAHRPSVQVQHQLPVLSEQQCFYLDQDSGVGLDEVQADFQKQIYFILGPERGWTQKEKLELEGQGHQAIKLAPTTLRVEHALFALLGQYHLLKKPDL